MLRIVTAPSLDPVTLAEAKAQLRLTTTDNDALVTSLIKAAVADVQNRTQRLLVSQTVEWILTSWPCDFRLPIAPVLAADVSLIKYYDVDDAQQTLSTDYYAVQQDGQTARIVLKFGQIWPVLSYMPVAEPIIVRFAAGDTVDNVPANIKAAILLIVRHLYSLGERSIFAQEESIDGVMRRRWQVSADALNAVSSTVDALLLGEQWA